jgi:putative membrane protein
VTTPEPVAPNPDPVPTSIPAPDPLPTANPAPDPGAAVIAAPPSGPANAAGGPSVAASVGAAVGASFGGHDATSVETDELARRRRLHPLTPLLRGAKFGAFVIAGISWQGFNDLGLGGWLLAVGGVMIVVLVSSVVSWFVTGYHVVGRELRVYEGLLWRRTRAIPLERLQTVELVQPLLARLFGLAELKLEVVGAAKTEAPLAFLPLLEARDLRERLLARSRSRVTTPFGAPVDAPVYAPVEGAAAPSTQVVHVVANRDLVISQLLRPQWWALPLAIAAPILYVVNQGNIGFIAVASTVTAVIGAVQAPVRVLLADWRFTIGIDDDGLRLRRGLLETRNQTVPRGRVQAVTVQWPLLWRRFGWVRATMRVAGVVAEGNQDPRGGSLVPVGTVPTAERVLPLALPGFVLTSVVVHPVPRRARWLAPLRRRVLGYQLTETAFVARDGLLTRQLVVVPYRRIQSVRIRQGPLDRLLDLASVWVDVAGGGVPAVALHRDAAEAVALAAELAERSRAARAPR